MCLPGRFAFLRGVRGGGREGEKQREGERQRERGTEREREREIHIHAYNAHTKGDGLLGWVPVSV